MAMKRLVRRLLWVLAGLVVLLIIAAVVVVLSLDGIVKKGINTVGPKVVKVPLSVEKVHISLLGGSFVLEGLKMGNPPGYDSPCSFTAGKIRVDANLKSLLSNEMIIPLVEVDRPAVTLEFKGMTTNMNEIMNGLGKSVSQPQPQPEKKSEKKMRIGLIRITGTTVSVAGLPAVGSVGVPVPTIQVSDLGGSGGQGATPEEVAARTFAAIYEGVAGAVGSVLPTEQLNTLRGGLSDALKLGQGVLDGGTKAAGQAATQAAGQLQKGIGSIFGGGEKKEPEPAQR